MGKISDYAQALKSKLTDLFVVYQSNNSELETKSVTTEQIGDAICGEQVHSDLKTDNQTIIGGINELAKAKNIADEYDDTHTYNIGDVTIYGNTLYICNTNNTTGTFDPSKWTATTIDDLIPKTDNNLPHYTGTPTQGSTAEAIAECSFTDYSSGVWTWRKWENGKLEIWGYDNSQMTVGASSWGSVYSIDIASLGDYPIAFLTLHSVVGAVYINGANGLGTLTGGTTYGLTKAPAYIFLRGTALGSDTRYITRNIYAVGTWK